MLALFLLGVIFHYTAGYSLCRLHVECIPGCVKLDKWGCKMCACGPAMFHPGFGVYGMPSISSMGGAFGGGFHPGSMSGGGPFGMSQGGSHQTTHSHTVKEKPLKECGGTMLCMMTCKGHYSLSSKVGSNGCRACTCPKEPVKEVIHVVEVVKPAPKPATHSSCTGTRLCVSTCKTKYILGERGRDGCQTCACLPEPKPTQPPKKECLATSMCIINCQHGYSMGNKGRDGCQACYCLPAPTPAPTQPPRTITIMCTKTMQCMLNCKDGYKLGSSGHDGCPVCQCLRPAKQIIIVKEVTCKSALSCNAGCSVGYKCGTDGCPMCECIAPQVVGLTEVHVIHTTKPLTCTTALSCPKSCTLGYKCGTDGCPTCECLIAVHTVTNTRPLVTKPQPQVNTGVTTIVKKCPNTLKCMSSCTNGYTLGSEGRDGCPTCTCVNTVKTECHTGCEHKEPGIAVHKCTATLDCMASCTDGYTIGDTGADGCPVCKCIQTTCHTGCEETHHEVIQVVQTTSGCSSGTCENKCTGDCNTSGGTVVAVSGGSSGGFSGGSGGMTGGGAVGGGSMTGGTAAGGGGSGSLEGGQQCPALPPNCHAWCIKYDVAHCRKCECDGTGTGAFKG